VGHNEPLQADADELLLFTKVKDVRPSVLAAAVLLVLVVGGGWGSVLLLRDATGAALGLGVAAAAVVGLPALWLFERHARHIAGWWHWRNRPVPAMRLTESGLDYSPAYTGAFPLHVDWGLPMECAYRRGPNNFGFFWCLYAPVIDGLGSLPAFIHRDWPLDPFRVSAEIRALVREAGVDKGSPEQMAAVTHLILYGTPIIINPYLLSGSPLEAADARLRDRTGGRCTLKPPPHRVQATTRGY
jgi:hypothetical protein